MLKLSIYFHKSCFVLKTSKKLLNKEQSVRFILTGDGFQHIDVHRNWCLCIKALPNQIKLKPKVENGKKKQQNFAV